MFTVLNHFVSLFYCLTQEKNFTASAHFQCCQHCSSAGAEFTTFINHTSISAAKIANWNKEMTFRTWRRARSASATFGDWLALSKKSCLGTLSVPGHLVGTGFRQPTLKYLVWLKWRSLKVQYLVSIFKELCLNS